MKIHVPAHQTIKEVNAPASKSFAQRAILAAALCTTTTTLKNTGTSQDVSHILEIAKQLGAIINYNTNGSIRICGAKNPPKQLLNCGESGLGVRLTASIAACLNQPFTLTGKGSLLNRPMDEFDRVLPQLGVSIRSNNGYLPLTISGKAHAGTLKLDGSLSSQYLSGLLMGLPLLNNKSIIHVNQLKSKPYIDCTLSVLQQFGITVTHTNYQQFVVNENQKYNSPLTYEIEGDYSGASSWMVHGAIANGITISGLNPKSVQADKMMLKALQLAGVQFEWSNTNQLLIKKGTIQPFVFDANECPDLFPSLVVLAAAANGKTTLLGVNRLTHKESNRGAVLQKEFNKLGLNIECKDDQMHIWGTSQLKSGTIDSHNDHRIAMAGGIAAALTPEGTTVVNAESVAKSYPTFWQDFKRC